MSYASLVRTLPETLRSSTGLAVLGSFGIHGLLWAILPVLPLESKSLEAKPQRTVGVIQLTPEEQSRLPQNSQPEAVLPPFAAQTSILPPLPPPPTFNVAPNTPFNTLPSNGKSISSYPFKAFATPKTIRVPSVSSQSNRLPITQPPAIPVPNVLPIPSTPSNQIATSSETLPPPWRQPVNRGLPNSGLLPSSIPEEFRNGQSLTTLPDSEPTTPIEGNSTTIPNTYGRSGIPQRGKDELLALRDRLRKQPTQGNSTGTTLAEATRNLSSWTASTGTTTWKNLTISPNYPQQACSRQLNGNASVAVLVNRGQITDGPRLIKKTGYDILDQAAVAAVRAYSFPTKSEKQAYTLALNFKYNNAKCANNNQSPQQPVRQTPPAQNQPSQPVRQTSPTQTQQQPATPTPPTQTQQPATPTPPTQTQQPATPTPPTQTQQQPATPTPAN